MFVPPPGHYGVVRIGTHKDTGKVAAIKSVPKRRAVYVEMLRLEVEALRVRWFLPVRLPPFPCACPPRLPPPQKLTHVNIIQLLDVFEDEQEVQLVWPCADNFGPCAGVLNVLVCLPQVFEACTGGELFEPIANRHFRFTEFEAATILRKLLRALEHMHSLDVIHRDLKPENVLFTEPGIDSELKVQWGWW